MIVSDATAENRREVQSMWEYRVGSGTVFRRDFQAAHCPQRSAQGTPPSSESTAWDLLLLVAINKMVRGCLLAKCPKGSLSSGLHTAYSSKLALNRKCGIWTGR